MRLPRTALACLGGGSLMCYKMLAMSEPAPSSVVFKFGVIADVQWADVEDGHNFARTVARRYRGALKTLERAVLWWNLLLYCANFCMLMLSCGIDYTFKYNHI